MKTTEVPWAMHGQAIRMAMQGRLPDKVNLLRIERVEDPSSFHYIYSLVFIVGGHEKVLQVTERAAMYEAIPYDKLMNKVLVFC